MMAACARQGRRSKRLLLAAAMLLAATLAGCLSLQSDTVYFVHGTVRDTEGRPVPGVIITAAGGDAVAESDEDGRWILTGVRNEMIVSAHKDRWTFAPAAVTVSPNSRRADFVGIPDGITGKARVTLRLPGHEVPVQSATVYIDDRTFRTDEHGEAVVYHLDPHRLYTIRVQTDFGSATWHGTLENDGTLPVSFDLSDFDLPGPVDGELLARAMGLQGSNHNRWRRGATIAVYFDYENAPPMSTAERMSLEIQVLDGLQAWLRDAQWDDPYLRWGGRVDRAADATLTVRILSSDAFRREYDDASPPTMRYYYDGERYTSHAMITVAPELRPVYPEDSASIFGWLFGLRYVPGSPPSVMNGRAILPTEWDLLALKVKMHLPVHWN